MNAPDAISMSPRRRLLTALALKQPDRVPVMDQIFNADIYQAALGFRPRYFTSEDSFKCSAALGTDGAFVIPSGYVAIEPVGNQGGTWESEWGCTYSTHEGAWGVGMPREYRIKSYDDLRHFTPPDPFQPGRMDGVKRAANLRQKQELALIGAVRGPFALTTYHFLGMVATMETIYDAPEMLQLAFRMATDFAIGICRQLADIGVDVLWITEDVAGTVGPLLSPAHYRRLVAPFLRDVCDFARSVGMPAVFHSDGYVIPFLDDLIRAGISGLDPLEPAAGMDLGKVKQQYGNRICLLGNVDNKRVLTAGTPELVEQTVKACIRAAGPGGGYVVMSDNSWHAGVRVENAAQQIRATHRWGRYPLDWIGD
jgi:uroporphyrinogen decarboxylase